MPLAASPSLRATFPGVPASFLYSAVMSEDEILEPELPSHSILSASRPYFACQNDVATTAIPPGTSIT